MTRLKLLQRPHLMRLPRRAHLVHRLPRTRTHTSHRHLGLLLDLHLANIRRHCHQAFELFCLLREGLDALHFLPPNQVKHVVVGRDVRYLAFLDRKVAIRLARIQHLVDVHLHLGLDVGNGVCRRAMNL